MDRKGCRLLIEQFLREQGWEVASARELSEVVCPDVIAQGVSGTAAKTMIQQQLRPRYAAILHDHCLRPEHEQYERAWAEVRAWLMRQARHQSYRPEKREDLVQETIIHLQQRLQRAALNTPRAFLTFALRSLQRKAVDQARSEQALFRGGQATTLSLEEAASAVEIAHPLSGLRSTSEQRETEAAALDKLAEERLLVLFNDTLPTELQRQVAKATFIDGLEPRVIAAQMGKPAHEIRLAKARVVERLRQLYAAGHPELREILKGKESP